MYLVTCYRHAARYQTEKVRYEFPTWEEVWRHISACQHGHAVKRQERDG